MKKLIFSTLLSFVILLNNVSALPMRTWNFGEYQYEPFGWANLLITFLAFIFATLIVWFLYRRMRRK